MDFNLNSNLVQDKQNRYQSQAENGRLVAHLHERESPAVTARQRLGAILVILGTHLHGATPALPDLDSQVEPITVGQTGP